MASAESVGLRLTWRLASRPRVHLTDLLEAQDLLLLQYIRQKHEWSTLFLIPTASPATVIVVLLSVVIARRRRHLQHVNRLNLNLIKLQVLDDGRFPIQEALVPFVNEINIRYEENFQLERVFREGEMWGRNCFGDTKNFSTDFYVQCTWFRLSIDNCDLCLLSHTSLYWLKFLMLQGFSPIRKKRTEIALQRFVCVIRTRRILSQFSSLSLRLFLHLRGKRCGLVWVWGMRTVRALYSNTKKRLDIYARLSLCMWPTDSDLALLRGLCNGLTRVFEHCRSF